MIGNLKLKKPAAVALTALAMTVAPLAASAATVDATVTSITAFWENTVPASVSVDNSGPTVTARWGNPATPQGQSGYDFTAAITPLNAPVNTNFALGEFVHQNFPVFEDGTVPGTLDLRLEISGELQDAAMTPFSVTSIFSFTHTETPNNGTPCAEGGSQPCPDLVEAILNPGASTSVSVGGVDYFFSITGFMTASGMFDSFLTLEDQSNSATLLGSFTADVNVNAIPLPAAGWMLLAGLGGLGLMRRKQKQEAA